jgi:hypothetical protein
MERINVKNLYKFYRYEYIKLETLKIIFGADANILIKGVRKQSAEEIMWPLIGTIDGIADKTALSRDSRLILFTEDCWME